MFNRTFRLGRAVPVLSAAAFVAALFSQTGTASAQATAPPPAKPAAPPAQAAAADTKDLPDARKIIDRHIEATGGRKALMALKSTHMTGTLSMPANGLSGALEVFAAAPNKQLVRVNLEGIGEVLEGYDGTVAWSINPMTGPTLATGKELEQKKLDADFLGSLHDPARYTSMKTLEKTTFEGRPCFKLSLIRKDGVEDIEFYDVETGLMAGRISTRENMMGAITVTQVLSDYKKFGSVLMPAKLTQSMMGMQQIMTTEKVEFDNVDPKVFELPEQIKALIK